MKDLNFLLVAVQLPDFEVVFDAAGDEHVRLGEISDKLNGFTVHSKPAENSVE